MKNERYTRNIPTLSEEDQAALGGKKVLVAGCGGLGGFVIEYLVRLGVGNITAVDGDCFEESNLNRQLLSSVSRLGYSKALAAKERASDVNPEVAFTAVENFITADNALSLIRGHDLVIDALDNAGSRLILEDAAAECGIRIIHGAVQGLNVQVITAPPGKNRLHCLYKSAKPDAARGPKLKSTLVMAPACCAAIEVSEALSLLLRGKAESEDNFIMLDLRDMSVQKLPAEAFESKL